MSKQKRRYITLVVVLALIVVGGASAGIWYALSNSTEKQTTSDKVVTPEQRAQDITDSLTEDSKPADVKKAQDQLVQLAEQASGASTRTTYYSSAINLSVDAGDYDQALKVSKQAEVDVPSAISAGDLAYIYEQQQKYELAAQYYQLAADRSEKPLSSRERVPYNDYVISKKRVEAEL